MKLRREGTDRKGESGGNRDGQLFSSLGNERMRLGAGEKMPVNEKGDRTHDWAKIVMDGMGRGQEASINGGKKKSENRRSCLSPAMVGVKGRD